MTRARGIVRDHGPLHFCIKQPPEKEFMCFNITKSYLPLHCRYPRIITVGERLFGETATISRVGCKRAQCCQHYLIASPSLMLISYAASILRVSL